MSTETDPRKLTLKQKLHAIMSEVQYIQKDKRNTFHNYTYASEAAIKMALHEAFVKYGVLFSCDPVAMVSERDRTSNKGAVETITTMQFHYRFDDVDSEEVREGTFFGSGSDAMDKGVYKATTGAIKYCLTTAFLIPTGDDPEAAVEEKKSRKEKAADAQKVAEQKLATMQNARPVQAVQRPKITEAQVKRMHAIANSRTWAKHEAKALLRTFNFASGGDVTVDRYEDICKVLERGPKVNSGVNISDADPLQYPGERVECDGKVYRPNAEMTAWEQVNDAYGGV